MKTKFERGQLPKPIVITEELVRARLQRIKERVADGELRLGDSADNDASLEAVNTQLEMEHRPHIDYSRKIFQRISTKEELQHAAQNSVENCMICFGEFSRKNKQVQCMFCSRCCCTQCCHRLRVNPEAESKSQLKALICDDCERQYLTILLSHDFYQEDNLLRAVNASIEKEIAQIQGQCEEEQQRIDKSKELRDNPDALKRTIRLANLKKEVAESKKDLDRLDKEYASSRKELNSLTTERNQRKEQFSQLLQQKQRKKTEELLRQEQEKREEQERMKQYEAEEQKRLQQEQRDRQEQAKQQQRKWEQEQKAEKLRMEQQMRQMAQELQREKDNKERLEREIKEKEKLEQERLDRLLEQRLEKQRIQQERRQAEARRKQEEQAKRKQQQQARLEKQRLRREAEELQRIEREKKTEWERQEQNRLRLEEEARLEEEEEQRKKRASVVVSQEERDRERLVQMFTNPEDQSRRNSRVSVVQEPERHISQVLTGGEASILSFRVKPSKQAAPVFDASPQTTERRQSLSISPSNIKTRSNTEDSPAISPAEAKPLSKEEILRSNSELPSEIDMASSHLDDDSKCKCVLF